MGGNVKMSLTLRKTLNEFHAFMGADSSWTYEDDIDYYYKTETINGQLYARYVWLDTPKSIIHSILPVADLDEVYAMVDQGVEKLYVWSHKDTKTMISSPLKCVEKTYTLKVEIVGSSSNDYDELHGVILSSLFDNDDVLDSQRMTRVVNKFMRSKVTDATATMVLKEN